METTGLRKAQHPTPAASRRANLWWGGSFSGKKRRGSPGRGSQALPSPSRVPSGSGVLWPRPPSARILLQTWGRDTAHHLGLDVSSVFCWCISSLSQHPAPLSVMLESSCRAGWTSHRPSAHHGPSAGLATTVGQELGGCVPHGGIPATFIITPS